MRWVYFKQAVKGVFKDPRLLFAKNMEAKQCREFWTEVEGKKG